MGNEENTYEKQKTRERKKKDIVKPEGKLGEYVGISRNYMNKIPESENIEIKDRIFMVVIKRAFLRIIKVQ